MRIGLNSTNNHFYVQWSKSTRKLPQFQSRRNVFPCHELFQQIEVIVKV